VYQNRLYAAWVEPSGTAVRVVSAPVRIPVQTLVAPALGVFTVDQPAPTQALFLAWTTPNSNIDFARWEGGAGQWVDSASPVALPAGPLTSYTPALNSSTSSCPSANDFAALRGADADVAASLDMAAPANNNRNVVAYTGPNHRVFRNVFAQVVHGCP